MAQAGKNRLTRSDDDDVPGKPTHFVFSANNFNSKVNKDHQNSLQQKNGMGIIFKVGINGYPDLYEALYATSDTRPCCNDIHGGYEVPDWALGTPCGPHPTNSNDESSLMGPEGRLPGETASINSGNGKTPSEGSSISSLAHTDADMEPPEAYNLVLERDLSTAKRTLIARTRATWTEKHPDPTNDNREELEITVKDIEFEAKLESIRDKKKYELKYKTWEACQVGRAIQGQKKQMAIQKTYGEYSLTIMAELTNVSDQDLRDKLDVSPEWKEACKRPCAMGMYQAWTNLIKGAGEQLDKRAILETDKLNQMKMKSTESMAAYIIRFCDQMMNCVDVGVTLVKELTMRRFLDSLADDYGNCSMSFFNDHRNSGGLTGWAREETLANTFKQVKEFDDQFIMPKRKVKDITAKVTAAKVKKDGADKTKERGEGTRDNSNRPCFRNLCGTCTRGDRCSWSHEITEAGKKEVTDFLDRHDCTHHANGCTKDKCLWKKEIEGKDKLVAKRTVFNPGLSGAAITAKKAALEPFGPATLAWCGTLPEALRLPKTSIAEDITFHHVAKKGTAKSKHANPKKDLRHTGHMDKDVFATDSCCNIVLTDNRAAFDDFTPMNCTLMVDTATEKGVETEFQGMGTLAHPLGVKAYYTQDTNGTILGDDPMITAGWTIGKSQPDNDFRMLWHAERKIQMKFLRNHEGLLICDWHPSRVEELNLVECLLGDVDLNATGITIHRLGVQTRASSGRTDEYTTTTVTEVPTEPATAEGADEVIAAQDDTVATDPKADTAGTKDGTDTGPMEEQEHKTNADEYRRDSTPKCMRNMQELGYSKTIIQRALLVGELHERLSYAGQRAMVKLLDSNRISDCKLTGTDARNYFKYLHKYLCAGCLLGKMKSYPAHALEREPPATVGAEFAFDEIFITFKGRPDHQLIVFFGKDSFSNFRNIKVTSRITTDDVILFITETTAIYQAYGHRIKKILMDQSSTHLSATPFLESQGYQIQYCDIGRHVTTLEADVDQVKRKLMAQLLGLEARLSHEYYEYGLYWTIDSLNLTFNADNDYMLPMEIFTGHKVLMEYHLRVKFGQLVVAKVKSGSSKPPTDETKGEYCIVVGRDLLSQGAVFLKRVGTNIKDARHVSRGDFVPCDNIALWRHLVEREGDGIVTAEDITTTWDSEGQEPITKQPPALEIFVDTTEEPEDEGVDYTDAPLEHPQCSGGALHHAEDNGLEETLNNKGLAEAHMPVLPEGIIYPDTGLDTEDHDSEEEQTENEPLEDQIRSDRLHTLSGRNPTKKASNPKHNPTVRRRMTRAALKLSIQEAQEKFGTRADDALWAEIQQLIDKGVFEFLLPDEVQNRRANGERILPCTIFLKEKYDAFNVLQKLKARMAVCGNFAKFNPMIEIESPTIAITILFLAIEIAARRNMTGHRTADIGGAYLHGESKAKHMMKIQKRAAKVMIEKRPELGQYADTEGSIVVELLKTLYGLREAGRVWYELIRDVLLDFQLTQSKIDKCLFHKTNEHGERMMVLLYVDDLLIFTDKDEHIDMVITHLKDNFNEVTTTTGNNISFLGLQIIIADNHDIKVAQSEYIKEIIDEMEVTDSAPTPATDELMKDREQTENCDQTKFYSITMKLMFAAVRTRPDILYPVSILAGRVKNPTTRDMNCLMRILRYLHGTTEDGLIYHANAEWHPHMSVDASFNHHFDAKGHSGFVIFPAVGSAGILCKSMKQRTTANSSCESELIALHEAVLYLKWVMAVYEELGYKLSGPVQIAQDNKATIQLASHDPVNFKGRSKFINRIYFSIYEQVADGSVILIYQGTDEMVSDFLTKALIGEKFRRFKVTLMGDNCAKF